MSKLKVSAIHDPDNDNEAITIDTSGNVTASQNLTISGTLSGDGSNLTGISSPLSFRNLIINGGMEVAQRGTSFTSSSGIYTLDRWELSTAVSATVTQETFTPGQTDVPNEPKNYLRFKNNSASSKPDLIYKIEDVRTGAGQTLTLSFYAKASQSMTTSIYTTQNFGSGGSGGVGGEKGTINLTTSWTKHTLTFSQASISGKTIGTSSFLMLYLVRILSGFSQNAYVDITNVQLEVGSSATDFEKRSYGEELARCQRYYYRIVSNGASPNPQTIFGTGVWVTTTNARIVVHRPTEMRTAPSLSTDTIGASEEGIDVHNATSTSLVYSSNQTSLVRVNVSSGGSTGVGSFGFIESSTGYVEFDAEL